MSAVYYLVKESDHNNDAKLNDIGVMLLRTCDTLFEDVEKTNYTEQKKIDAKNAIRSALCYSEAPYIDFCAITHNGVSWREFGSLVALKQHLSEVPDKYIILDEYNDIISLEEFEKILISKGGK